MCLISPFAFSSQLQLSFCYVRLVFTRAPVLVFFFVTLVFSMEGWACWIMILPLFLLMSTIGGLIAGHYKDKENDNINRLRFRWLYSCPLLLLL